MKIIFFGSTIFSLPIVKKINEHFELLGVVIVKPRPRGRGLRITLPVVVEWAQTTGVPIFSPENPNDINFIDRITSLKPDVFVLSAYGHILNNKLLDVPKHGGLNIHPSLLPKYRGAAPIQRSLMAGEEKTGITVFFMDEKIDHGEIIFQKELSIESDDTYGSLLSKLSTLGAEIIVDVLKSVDSGTYKKIKQDDKEKIYAPKIKKEEMIINWNDSAEKIASLVRALSPKPGAQTSFRSKKMKIIQAHYMDMKLNPGIIHIEKKKIYIGTGDGSINVMEVQPEGKSRISGLDFINGFRIKEGEMIE